MKEFRNPQDVHKPVGSYSHQIEIKGKERLLVISGQVGMREDGTIPEDPFDQIDTAFENIFRNLRAAGMEIRDLIKITYYLVGEIDTVKRREIVLSKLQGHQPCSTLLYVAALASPAFRVEIDAWASRAEQV
ncbi:MAG TPA: RidA family protein [Anaerolineales bacterium]|nr:RidA family protein [Anaerolineales bacterium]